MTLPGAPALGSATKLALNLAQQAGEQLRQQLGAVHKVHAKARGDWCSGLDQQLERRMRQRVAQLFPSHGFLGEEEGHSAVANAEWLWVVDPIDGSMNFLRGLPHFSVSVALLHQGMPVVGVVHDPCRCETFIAALGEGAWLNGQRLRVSPTVDLGSAVAATVFPKPGAAFMNAYLAQLGRALNQVAGVRRAGSMALDLAYVAAGRVDVFWARGMGVWDAAAGMLLVQEAGGEVLTLDGLGWMQSKAIAAATPALKAPWERLLSGDAAG